jgi:hypothetical protein
MDAPIARRRTRISLGCTLPSALLRVLPVAAAMAVGAVGAGAAAAQAPDPVFAVERFEIGYAEAHPDLPPLSALLPVEVELAAGPDGWQAPGPAPFDRAPGAPPRADAATTTRVRIGAGNDAGRYHASALAAIATALLERVKDEGLVGVFVAPHPDDVDVHSERDLRPPGDGILRIQISVGRVRELRSVAVGDRIRDDWKVNNPAHREIRRQSPIQPAALVRKGTTDLVRIDELEDYLFRLNRHPGRRVEAALAAAEGGDGVALDLRVHEARPWFAFSQTSNTGTSATAIWQTRSGFVHRQLTGRDDILSIQYTNGGGNDVHAVHASYEAPWFGSRRPDWWHSQPDEATWQRWLHRDALPWWGLDRLRWRVDGSWSRFDAKNVDLIDDIRGDEWQVASHLVYETFQWRNLFVDTFFGTRMRKVSVLNRSFAGTSAEGGDELFFLPELGVEIERLQETSTFRAVGSFEVNVAGTFDPQLQNLGRPQVDGDYQLIRYDLGTSQFLEPLLFPKAWKDPSTPRTSTLSHEIAVGFRGQYAFDYRLIPQASQVVGGLYSVRGYDPSVSVGDSVWIASAEYRFHLPRSLPIAREPLDLPVIGDFRAAPQQVYGRPDWDFVIRAFVDAGRTVRNPRPDGTRPPGEVNETLLGAGIGAEFRFRHNLTARVDWGHALKDAGCGGSTGAAGACRDERGDDELHFLFSVVY